MAAPLEGFDVLMLREDRAALSRSHMRGERRREADELLHLQLLDLALLSQAPCTLHPAPCTLHPAPCTLHPAPCTLHLLLAYSHGLTRCTDLALLSHPPTPTASTR